MKPLLRLINPGGNCASEGAADDLPGNDLGFVWREINRRGETKLSNNVQGCALHQASEVYAVSCLGFQLAAARAAAGLNTPLVNGEDLMNSASMETREGAMRKAALFAHRVAVGEFQIRCGQQPFLTADEFFHHIKRKESQ